jgi:hypothetical protein
MELNVACCNILLQLKDLVNQISDDDYARPVPALGGSAIGQHLRHTLEFFICLEQGFQRGSINYDKRAHDKLIERERPAAGSAVDSIIDFVNSRERGGNPSLRLEVGYDLDREEFVSIETNYSRELVYNIEHAVHHMAIIKIGVRTIAPYVKLPNDFGIAASTLRYQESMTAAPH